ncbi:alpha/beta hydrolase [Caulobacter sp. D4A]|nr:alpha/beta hydrolase [Caulobacter sp. D4A]PXA85551.1 alpha/beta hydrolase [Caulobacter sp. D4A]PXA94455.1 alpha/beta hydrolase [Caulobacter sp. D5]
MMIDRRALLLGAGSLAAAPLLGAASGTAKVETITLKVQDRTLPVLLARPEKPKGLLLFSHGAGGQPSNYQALFDAWSAAGFLVVAPTHVDSKASPDSGKYTLRQAFALRLLDLAAASLEITADLPSLPVASAGHSYGSLMALMMGGALETVIPARNPDVKAVLCFSSPGVIQGLIGPTAYQGVKGPMMMITGDKDVLPGVIEDWHEHLYPFDTSAPGGKYLWVGKGVGHSMSYHPEDPGFPEASALSVAFLKAKVLGDAGAEAALAAQASTPRADWKTR